MLPPPVPPKIIPPPPFAFTIVLKATMQLSAAKYPLAAAASVVSLDKPLYKFIGALSWLVPPLARGFELFAVVLRLLALALLLTAVANTKQRRQSKPQALL